MISLLWVLAILLLAPLLWLASLSGAYRVSRSIVIPAPRKAIFDKICDFKSWGDWSPWLIHDPDALLEFSENCDKEGGSYSWDSQVVGAGTLSHVALQPNAFLRQRLAFTRPMRAECEVQWRLEELEEGSTRVTWSLSGKMPFLFRFMVNRTKKMIAQDYDFGLAMLAGELAESVERPYLSFEGPVELPDHQCVCLPFSGGLEAMQAEMGEAFPRLAQHLQEAGVQPAAEPLAVYHKVNEKNGMFFVVDMAVPVEEAQAPELAANGILHKKIPGGRFFKVTLTGSYDFLEHAWPAAFNHVRMKKHKFDMRRPSLEIYLNNPIETPAKELLTAICIPIKDAP